MAEKYVNLDEMTKQLLNMAEKSFPEDTKIFLRTEGSKLNKKAKAKARKKVGKRGKGPGKKENKKRYLSGFKRGKPYEYEPENSFAIRVYNARPHAHLIEYGHEVKPHTRNLLPKDPPLKGKKRTEAKEILHQAAEEFEEEYGRDAETFVDDLLERGLGL